MISQDFLEEAFSLDVIAMSSRCHRDDIAMFRDVTGGVIGASSVLLRSMCVK